MNDSIMRTIPIFLAIIRYFLAALFLISSVDKIREPKYFINAVRSYHLLPQFAVRPFAYLLPLVEFTLGFILVVGWQTRPASAITALLYVIFTGALGLNLMRGQKSLGCGCFGAKSHKISLRLVMQDIALALAAGGVACFGGGSLAFDNLSRGAQSLEVLVLAEYLLPTVLVGIGLYTVWLLFRQMLRLLSLSTQEENK